MDVRMTPENAQRDGIEVLICSKLKKTLTAGMVAVNNQTRNA